MSQIVLLRHNVSTEHEQNFTVHSKWSINRVRGCSQKCYENRCHNGY